MWREHAGAREVQDLPDNSPPAIRVPSAPVNEGSRESQQVRGVGARGWRARAWELSPPEQRDPGQLCGAAFLLARHLRTRDTS